jgi:hypothetical protein
MPNKRKNISIKVFLICCGLQVWRGKDWTLGYDILSCRPSFNRLNFRLMTWWMSPKKFPITRNHGDRFRMTKEEQSTFSSPWLSLFSISEMTMCVRSLPLSLSLFELILFLNVISDLWLLGWSRKEEDFSKAPHVLLCPSLWLIGSVEATMSWKHKIYFGATILSSHVLQVWNQGLKGFSCREWSES